jgi:hypothetical protein
MLAYYPCRTGNFSLEKGRWGIRAEQLATQERLREHSGSEKSPIINPDPESRKLMGTLPTFVRNCPLLSKSNPAWIAP